jgi:hypothetical protein
VGGNVTSDGGAEITERGVVYSTNHNPTTEDSKVKNDTGVGEFTCDLTNLQEATTYYVRAYAINAKGTSYGGEVSFTSRALSGIENGYAWVDLGLSVVWATMNVGASGPEYRGNYFAWGETSTKSTYNWSTYKWYDNDGSALNKYYYKDNKTELEAVDDAATINWGGNWRMPTDAEWTELRELCTWTWITLNGVDGYKITSRSNDNSIFLPAAGCKTESGSSYVYYHGNYWSSSIHSVSSQSAWSVSFTSSNVKREGDLRYCGLSVRPVCP